jgi:hypothetical protein
MQRAPLNSELIGIERVPSRREAVQSIVSVVAILGANACYASTKISVPVPDYRLKGDKDDTAAVNRALKTGQSVYFPARQGSGQDGAYILSAVTLPSHTTMFGDGSHSVLRAATDTMNVLVAMSATAAQTVDNIVLRDLRIEGPTERIGFREHWDLVSLSGVSGVRILRVEFVGFAGDGLLLGAEKEGITRQPRIIRDVVVSDCVFDGVNNDNRNGISVTGGDGITILRCRFRRCTRANMPGPIDFEPDAFGFYRLRRLRVIDCDFEECGGNVGQISVVIPAIVPPPQGAIISGNRFRRYRGTGGDITVTINREPHAATIDMECVIEDNIGAGGNGGFQIFSGKGITIRNNRWTNYGSRSFLGYPDVNAGVIDVLVSDRFDGCGSNEGIALALYKGENIRLVGNQFLRTGNGGKGSAPLYVGTGRIRRLSIERNNWQGNPNARGLVIIERGADYLPGTALVKGNLLPPGRTLPAL